MKHSEKEKTTLDSLSPKLNRNMVAYHETGDLFADTCEIVESAQSIAYIDYRSFFRKVIQRI
ncbi:hypothetical protein [Jingyaoa shaoxingensis]|uniref:Uncharacterized protein n=1 Tax=Jingyaoa shaoxingensis TaxID=2763671 RepID=A0ABR7N717_9FIRM|nr:hypothetical protein [Jingyaoa shaoxingensis]MBC8572192.1 hypothetical protein [Jingyaoa shaoxingensis]